MYPSCGSRSTQSPPAQGVIPQRHVSSAGQDPPCIQPSPSICHHGVTGVSPLPPQLLHLPLTRRHVARHHVNSRALCLSGLYGKLVIPKHPRPVPYIPVPFSQQAALVSVKPPALSSIFVPTGNSLALSEAARNCNRVTPPVKTPASCWHAHAVNNKPEPTAVHHQQP